MNRKDLKTELIDISNILNKYLDKVLIEISKEIYSIIKKEIINSNYENKEFLIKNLSVWRSSNKNTLIYHVGFKDCYISINNNKCDVVKKQLSTDGELDIIKSLITISVKNFTRKHSNYTEYVALKLQQHGVPIMPRK